MTYFFAGYELTGDKSAGYKWKEVFPAITNPQTPRSLTYPSSATLSADKKLFMVPVWTPAKLYFYIFDLTDDFSVYTIENYHPSKEDLYQTHFAHIHRPIAMFAQGNKDHKNLYLYHTWEDGSVQGVYVTRDENITLTLNTTLADKYEYDMAIYSYNHAH